MGSIPLPALAVQPPQQQDPLATVKNALALKSIGEENQVRAEQATAIQQENQARDLAMKDQLASRQAMIDASGDPDKYLENLQKSGVSGKYFFEQSQGINTMRKSALDLTEQQHKVADQNNDWLTGQMESLRKTPPEQRQSAYQGMIYQAQRRGMNIGQFPTQIPTDDATLNPVLDQFESQLKLGTQIRAEAKQAAETFKAQQEGNKAQTENALSQIKLKMAQNAKPGDLDSLIDQIAPTPAMGGYIKQRVNFSLQRGDLEGAQKVVDQFAGQAGQTQQDIARETNPIVQAGKEQVAKAEGQSRANTEINTKRQETSDAQFQTAVGADERLNRMEKSYTDAAKGNQQAMLALLTDHIGMTLGLQKGARITKDIIQEAAKSQPWLDSIKAKFDDDGYLSGVTLGPNQMKQMLDLGYSARENAWQNARSTSQLYNVAPPPNADKVYAKRDPNARVYDQTTAPSATGPNGHKIIVENGRWVDAETHKPI